MDDDFKFEEFEKYYGGPDNVKRIIDECEICGSQLVFAHLPDYKNLLIEESSHCPNCGNKPKKVIHILS